MSAFPSHLRFTKDHEWAYRDGDAIVVGITSHAVDQLGDITLVTVLEPGKTVGTGERFGDIDSVKAVSELFSPVAGEIVARNDALDNTPESVNQDPYGKGWMVKIRPSNPSEFDTLMSADDYTSFVARGG